LAGEKEPELIQYDPQPNRTVLPMVDFQQLFKSQVPTRDKFLSRLFGIFNEEPVRIWCAHSESPYGDLGRPTLKKEGTRGSTLDFTFRAQNDGRLFVGELKCELEYNNYRYLTLTNPAQLAHHSGDAFKRFLAVAEAPDQFTVTVHGRPVEILGSILVWGSVTEEGKRAVMADTGVADVLSLEDIIGDLIRWRSEKYTQFIKDRAEWCDDLFSTLEGVT